ncbi:MAG TPA: hypothetical protein VJ731_01895 [Terriglobales bacterium]|nr:hypothetical protein [Terriglobales bacterium]
MKNTVKIVGALVLALAAIAANAQTTYESRVTLPFSFTAAGKSLPAGDYRVFFDPSNSLLTLQQGKSVVLRSLTSNSDILEHGESFLRFDAVGQENVLSEFAFAGNVHRIPASHVGRVSITVPAQSTQGMMGSAASQTSQAEYNFLEK